MKNKLKNILILLIVLSLSANVFAHDAINEDSIPLDEKTGFPLILKKPFPVFDYGLSSSIVTRIIKQNERSNFVFEDYFLGAYVAMQSRNMEPLDSMLRIAVYYPVAYKFNDVPQAAVNMLNFAVDVFAAPYVNLSLWHYLTFDLGGGLHYLYQQGDRWHYHNLGLGAFARINMPIARRWSLFVDGIASLDYGNLGTNKRMEPYDYVWQYQVAIGFRYSRKSPNKYSYIPSKRTYAEEIQLLVDKQQDKNAKKEAKAAIKAEKKALEDAERLEKEASNTEKTESEFNLRQVDSVLNEDVDAFDKVDKQEEISHDILETQDINIDDVKTE